MDDGAAEKTDGGARSHRQAGGDGRGATAVVNAMLVGVGGVYVATSSALATLAAAGAAVLAVALIARVRR